MKKLYVNPRLEVIVGVTNPIMEETSWTVKKSDGTEIDGGDVIEGDPEQELDAKSFTLWED